MTESLCRELRWLTRHQVNEVTAAAQWTCVTPYGQHVWDWFWQLERSRRVLNGLEPLSHVEVRAWAAAYGERPAPWELDALFRLDAVRRESFAAEQRKIKLEAPSAKDPALASMVPFNAEGVRATLATRAMARSARVG